VARAECEGNIKPAKFLSQPPVLVLRIDDENLSAETQSSHRQSREKVGLAGARVAEDSDVGVGVAAVVERVDHDGLPGGPAGTDDQAGRLLQVGVEPREHRDQRGRVQHPPPAQRIAGQRQCGEAAVELPEGCRQELAQRRAPGRLDPHSGRFKLFCRWGTQGQIERHVEGTLLARSQPLLESLRGRSGALDLWITDAAGTVHLGSAHVDELALEVVHHPGGRQSLGMPAEGQAKSVRHEPEEPAGHQLNPRKALQPPGAVTALAVLDPAGRLFPEEQPGWRLPIDLADVGHTELA